jgi:UMF1 family MFS transporter
MNNSWATRKEVLAWALYDWANSAYSTLSITLLVAYLQKVVLPGPWGPVAWAWGISASMLVAGLASPPLGALADANASKRRWLTATALGGAMSAVGLGLVPPTCVWGVLTAFFVTVLLFELSIGFYNAFLTEISTPETMGRVSAWGFTLGYLGGALALVLGVLLLKFGPRLGLNDLSTQLRAGIVLMGLWWGLFSLPALAVLRDRRPAPTACLPLGQAMRQAGREVLVTLRNVRRYRMVALFVLAYLFYNDGVQTTISQASTFAMHDLRFTPSELIGVILMIQLVAMPGAMLVGFLADRWLGQKRTLVLTLAIWAGLLMAALLVRAKWQFWILGAVVALVLGGTQAVSRSVMGLLTPPRHTGEFFGFYNLSGKATAFLGTFLFGLVSLATGSSRLAIASLLVLFVIGWGLLVLVDVHQGRREANAEGGSGNAE